MIFQNDLKEKLDYFILTCRQEGRATATINDYKKKLSNLRIFLKNTGVESTADVTRMHIRMFLESRRQYCSEISVHGYYRSVKRFFNFLVEEELLEKSPMDHMHISRGEQKIIRPFTVEEIGRLLTLCVQRTFIGSRDRALILIFYDTGLRLREMASVKLADIDPDREVIKVMGKGARERVVRIGIKTQHALARYLMMRRINGFDSPKLWVNAQGRPLTAEALRQVIKRLGQRAELTGVRCSPHTFRHSFGTTALRNKADIREVQILLGHSTLNTTLRYVATVASEDAIAGHRGTIDRRGFSPVDRMELKEKGG